MVKPIFGLVFRQFIGLFGLAGMILSLINKSEQIFACYSSCGALDTTMGVYASRGPAGYYGYWVQQSAGGHLGLLFPGYWMAAH
jgi:hypothetical protein